MPVTPASILAAIDRRRLALAAQTGAPKNLPYTWAAAAIGVHSSLISRLKAGQMPAPESIDKIALWVGGAEALECETCDGLALDEEDSDEETGMIVALIPAEGDPIMAASSSEPSAHITTVWMGDDPELIDVDAILAEVATLAEVFEPFTVAPDKRGTLGDDGADVVFVDGADLFALREALLAEGTAVRAAFDAVEQFPEWTPHITLGYPDNPARTDYDIADHAEVSIDRIAVWIAGRYDTYTLGEITEDDAVTAAAADDQRIYAIQAVGARLSDSSDPETQAAVARVRELLMEGAVGVSVMLDFHPDDAAIISDAEARAAEDDFSQPFESYLPEGFTPRQRIRHTAIVDTPAFADARLTIDDDGSLSGPVTFEGIWTGDIRFPAEPMQIDLEATRVPSPIIWDRHDGDHTGMTVGSIAGFERAEVEAAFTSGRPILDDRAITASMQGLTFPARYFAATVPTAPEPIRIGQPDARGYRSIRGLAAPVGTCHRGAATCFTYPGTKDKTYAHFHTGALVGLDDGRDIRVGALTLGGAHLDVALAREGVVADRVGSHRDDANRVFALVRAFESRFGLMIAGVIPPDITEATVARALACAPSVELWPTGRRGERALVGVHLVPRPAWPVMASLGSAELVASPSPIELEEPGEEVTQLGEVMEFDMSEMLTPVMERLTRLDEALARIHQDVSTVLALTPVPDDIIPE